MLAFSSHFLYVFPALIISLTVHEAMHAYVAVRMGDSTPIRDGRVTLNPFAHLTLLGTLMILFAPIGWGKPVMYNPYNFHNYKWGTILTAAAGPFGNFVLAFATAIPLNHMTDFLFDYPHLYLFLQIFFQMNIVLMVFNLLPIPPLDGSKIIMALIPNKHQMRYERWMSDGGFNYFMGIFLFDYILGKYFGFSILSTVLEFMAMPFVALINLGM